MSKMKKITNVLSNILLGLFLVVAVLVVVLTIFSNKGADGASEIFGYQMRIVTSDSMAACEYTDVSDFEIKDIPVRSMVFVKMMPKDAAEADDWYRDLKVGDVLTFRYVYTTQVTITHRITAIVEKESGGFIIELAGDNKNSQSGQMIQRIDTSIPENTNYVIGKVVGQAYWFGAVLSFLMQPVGMILIIIVPCVAIILLEVGKIFKALTAEKREKEQEEKDQKEKELEQLRSRLAALEQEKLTEVPPAAQTQAPAQPTEGKEE